MASGLCAALTGRTHGCTDQPANVKKTLANSEPSTHGTCETSTDVCSTVAFGGKADLEQAAQQTSQRFAAVFDAVVEACGLNMDEIVFPPAPIASLSHRIA
jgi:glutamate-1-semialdehyde aminotransferase